MGMSSMCVSTTNVNGELARYNIATKQIEDPAGADEASE